jgi:Peroxidase
VSPHRARRGSLTTDELVPTGAHTHMSNCCFLCLRALSYLAADLRLAPTTLRLGFHASFTYRAATGTGGSQCLQDYTQGANAGLATVSAYFNSVAASFNASRADVYTLAGVVAVQLMAGPTVTWRSGRVDNASCSFNVAASNVLLPDPMTDGLPTSSNGALYVPGDQMSPFNTSLFGGGDPTSQPNGTIFAPYKVRAKFSAAGLNDQDTVALMGAHSVGFAHPAASGFAGSWTSRPFLMSNEYFWTFANSPPNTLTLDQSVRGNGVGSGTNHFFAGWVADTVSTATVPNPTLYTVSTCSVCRNAFSGSNAASIAPSTAITSNSYVVPFTINSNGPGNIATTLFNGTTVQGAPQMKKMMLATDMALLADASYLTYVQQYSAGTLPGTLASPTAGSTAFFTQFAISLQKLHELGVPASQLVSVSLSPSPASVASPPPAFSQTNGASGTTSAATPAGGVRVAAMLTAAALCKSLL